MFKKLFKHLENRGFAPCSVGQHTGECDEPYIVIKERGEAPVQTSLAARYLDITVFYPLGTYSELQSYIDGVKGALSDLRGLKDAHMATPTVVDNQLKAYTVTMTYRLICRKRG